MAKGLYTPINVEKYLGDPTKIRFLSSWELRFMDFCDKNPNILLWGSEEFKIPYMNPIKKKVCSYYPDFIVKYKDRNGNVLTEVIEIKPACQDPNRVVSNKGKRKKPSTYDTVQMVINQAKWTAAKAYCESHGVKFRVLTERELFL
jgi:hypothetical protein